MKAESPTLAGEIGYSGLPQSQILSCAFFASTGISLRDVMSEDAEWLRRYATDPSEAAFRKKVAKSLFASAFGVRVIGG